MKKAIIISFYIFILIILLFYHTHGLTFHDNGYIVHSAQQLQQGKVIYRDFDFVYTPLSVFLTAIAFKLFGQNLFAERLFIFFLSLTTIFSIYKICLIFTRRKEISYTVVLIYLFWGPGHINFFSPVMLSIDLGILGLFFLMRGLETKKFKYFFPAGILSGSVLLSKQNFGLAILLTVIFFFLVIKIPKKIKSVLFFILGYFTVIIAFLIYLVTTNSYGPFISNMYFYIIKKIIIENTLKTPFIYEGALIYILPKIGLYLFPALISAVAIFTAFKKYRNYLFLAVFVLFFYLFGIRPETDYIHLSPLLSLTGLSLIFLWKSEIKIVKQLSWLFCITLITVGLYTSLFKGYYRWERPLSENRYFIVEKTIQIWSDPNYKTIVPFLVKNINLYSKPEDYIFVNFNAPLIYFIVNRRDPTRFSYISHYATSEIFQKEIINNLINKKVKLIIADSSLKKNGTPIDIYIRKNYRVLESLGEYFILLKTH